MTSILEEQVVGCIVGGAIGDALGGPYEGQPGPVALQPDAQARYGILVNQGVLCLNQARLAERAASLPWLLPQMSNLTFASQGVADAYR